MAKNENLYIKEFVDYYLKLGIDHIFIYDDNEPNTEKISNVFNNSYKSHITIYDNIINKTLKDQSQVYTLCYNNNKNVFDWIFMIDIDEYLIIKNNTLKNYLSNEVFEKCDFVKIHWVVPTDNDILHYDNRTLLERFKGPYMNDTHVKTFVKGKIEGLKFDIHSPVLSPFNNISCDNNGEKYNNTNVFFNDVFDINYDKAYIIHFKYKSTEEYINKYKRGYRNWFGPNFLSMRIEEYFLDNKITLEKIEYIEKELKLDLSKYKEKLKPKKNLIIGTFSNYNFKIIEPFFKSFKMANYENCDCIMFIDNVLPETINKVKYFGVITYPVPDNLKIHPLINYRWKIYEDFLKDNKDKYNLVFTTDLRDSIFQKDLFKFYNNDKPFLGLAVEDGIIDNEPANKKWILNAYGEDIYKTLQYERVICIGTIWGTPDKFYELSKIMWEKLSSEWSISKKVIEQAVLNYIIYHDKMFNDCIIKSENKDGPIMTIGIAKREDITLDNNDNILNGKGDIAAVIHQYDRKKDILAKIKNKYCS